MPAKVPWLAVTAAEYEAHMGPEGLDQLAPLSQIFGQVYRAARPARLLVLGCGTGAGLEHVDPDVTERVVGLDLNLQYLAVARQRLQRLGARVELYCRDVLAARPPPGAFDLVHAALLLEYLPAEAAVSLMASATAPAGTSSVVLRLPGGEPAEEASPIVSLRAVAASARPVAPSDLAVLFERQGLRRSGAWEVAVKGGRRLHAATFRR